MTSWTNWTTWIYPTIPELPDDLPDLPDGDYNFGDWEVNVNDDIFTVFRWVNINFPMDALQLPNLWWQSWIGVNAATATKEGLEAKLGNLYAQRAQPQAMHVQGRRSIKRASAG